MNSGTARVFNEAWFRKTPRRTCGALVPLTSFLHPLDGVANWNLLYGKRGFVQYQFVVAPRHAELVRTAVSLIAHRAFRLSWPCSSDSVQVAPGHSPSRSKGGRWLSTFPLDPSVSPLFSMSWMNWSLAVDGRVYLAKDARLRPELLAVMYPRLGELVTVRRRVDPHGVLESDLSRRLGLTGAHTL